MAPKGFDPLSSKDVELEKTLATFVASSLKINTFEKMATFVVFDHVCGTPVYAEISDIWWMRKTVSA